MRATPKNLLLTVSSYLFVAGCSVNIQTDPKNQKSMEAEYSWPLEPQEISEMIFKMFKENRSAEMAAYIHPLRGLRIAPHGYMDTTTARFYNPKGWEELHQNAQDRLHFWGFYDGSGDSIWLSRKQYFSKFIYDADFLQSPVNAVDSLIGKGNSLINFKDLYPCCSFTEHHFPGFNPEYSGMDWKSLRLVYQMHQNSWYLVAIIHDQ